MGYVFLSHLFLKQGRLAQQQFHTQQLQQERELAVSHAQFLDTDRVQVCDYIASVTCTVSGYGSCTGM